MLLRVDRLPQSMDSRIPALGPSARPAAAPNSSRRFCRGELAPREPKDESASLLFKRIARRLPAPRPSARPTSVPWRSLHQGQAQRALAPKAKRARKST